MLFSWPIDGNFIWLKYFGSEVQSIENDDTANEESIHNMA